MIHPGAKGRRLVSCTHIDKICTFVDDLLARCSPHAEESQESDRVRGRVCGRLGQSPAADSGLPPLVRAVLAYYYYSEAQPE